VKAVDILNRTPDPISYRPVVVPGTILSGALGGELVMIGLAKIVHIPPIIDELWMSCGNIGLMMGLFGLAVGAPLVTVNKIVRGTYSLRSVVQSGTQHEL
jgi:hypothetical protein